MLIVRIWDREMQSPPLDLELIDDCNETTSYRNKGALLFICNHRTLERYKDSLPELLYVTLSLYDPGWLASDQSLGKS